MRCEALGGRGKTTNPSRFATYGIKVLGDYSEGETPVPIPNTEVKPFSADGTAWVTVWESRTLPRIKLVSAKAGIKGPSEMMGFVVCASPFPHPISILTGC